MEYFATSNGIPVHINDTGKGENVLILLHGYLESLYIWTEFIDSLPDSVRVIAIDLPGHGLTGTHPSSNTMPFCAAVVRGVLDLVKVKKCFIGGHSMGGYVAQCCVKLFPQYFKGAIFFSSVPFSASDASRQKHTHEIELINQGKLMTLANLSVRNLYFKDNLRQCDNKIEETVEICETHNPAAICASITGFLSREDSVEVLSHAALPILFIFGQNDALIPVETQDRIRQVLPDAQVVSLPACGHNSFIEQTGQVLALVKEFIGE